MLAIAACQEKDLDEEGQAVLLATGIVSSSTACDIIVWAAQREYRSQHSVTTRSDVGL